MHDLGTGAPINLKIRSIKKKPILTPADDRQLGVFDKAEGAFVRLASFPPHGLKAEG